MNDVECRRSLFEPWLLKFRGLSREVCSDYRLLLLYTELIHKLHEDHEV